VDQAGAFAIVVEGVARDLADEITGEVNIPTIGIGASPSCDGQILVTDDMIGLFDWTRNSCAGTAPCASWLSKRSRPIQPTFEAEPFQVPPRCTPSKHRKLPHQEIKMERNWQLPRVGHRPTSTRAMTPAVARWSRAKHHTGGDAMKHGWAL
jgi:hypothetical protein